MPVAETDFPRAAEIRGSNHGSQRPMRILVAVACVVIISAGMKAASDLLSLVLLGSLLAYSALPFLNWMIRKFRLRKSVALSLSIALVGAVQVIVVAVLYEQVGTARERLPAYEERWHDLIQNVTVFLQAHDISTTSVAGVNLFLRNEGMKVLEVILPEAGQFLSNALAIVVLGGLLLSSIAEDDGSASAGSSTLSKIRHDVAGYIGVSAITGILTAVANFALLTAFGVDFALVWCILYFFLQFVPSIGYLIALIPPTFLALLMLGWKKALLVAIGLALTQQISDYLLTPLFLKRKGATVSFVEMTLSLMWWSFLFGAAGGILAVPLTLALKRVIPNFALFKKTNGSP